MENISLSMFSSKLSYRIGILIILSVFFVLISTGFFYISKFSNETSLKFQNQMAAPAKLMSTGKLNYDAAMDIKTLSSLVGDSVIHAIVIGKDKKIYYAATAYSLINQSMKYQLSINIKYLKKKLKSLFCLAKKMEEGLFAYLRYILKMEPI